MNWRNLTLVVYVSGLLITLSTWVANVSISKLSQPKQPSTQLFVKQLRSSAQAITVAVPIETVRHPTPTPPSLRGYGVHTSLSEPHPALSGIPLRSSERETFPRSQVVPRSRALRRNTFPRSRALRGNA
ncbi:hypothetical protein SD80_025815 [Scytonema tolypothrichoides VB-61278]|nr:hypothetical protein SD80_025815 [Scytonema tolypothrichoides VB-61278]